MKIQITTRHCDLTPELRDYTEDRVRRLKRYFEHIIDVSVILTSEKHRHLAEATLHTGRVDLVGTAESPELSVSIDQAIDRIEAQLRKHKDRITDRKGRVPLGEALAAEAGAAATDGEEDGED